MVETLSIVFFHYIYQLVIRILQPSTDWESVSTDHTRVLIPKKLSTSVESHHITMGWYGLCG